MRMFFHLRTKLLPIAGIAATLAGQYYKAHHIDPQPFEVACKDLGLKNPEAVFKTLYYSGTLTEKSVWANLKRANVSNSETIWRHSVSVLKFTNETGNFHDRAKDFFGNNVSLVEKIFGAKQEINPTMAKKLLIAQTQEVFGRKDGQERDVLWRSQNIDNGPEIISGLKKLGFIDFVSPVGDEKVVVIPGASMLGVVARIAYVQNLENQGSIRPLQKVITAGDRPLTSNLDALDEGKIVSTGGALSDKGSFDSIRKILLSKGSDTREVIFKNLIKNLQECYYTNSNQLSEIIKGHKMEGSYLNETGGSAYLLFAMNLNDKNYVITHTPKYADGRRPDTDSTAKTFAEYYFDDLYKSGENNELGISSNQPYVLRQGKSFERAIIAEAKARNIDPNNVNISFFGFEYTAQDAKVPLSEFAATVAEFGKDFFEPQELNSLMYRTRDQISTEDMPTLGDNTI